MQKNHSFELKMPLHLDFKAYDYFSRSLLIIVTAFLVVLLHGAIFIWYLNRPVPKVYTPAAPLPMIDIALQLPAPAEQKLETPPAPPQPQVQPQTEPVEKPVEKKIAPKPIIKKQTLPAPLKKPADKLEIKSSASPPPAPAVQSDVPSVSTKATSPVATPQPVIQAHADANYLNNPKPVYPRIAQQRHWEGTVILRVHVTADGRSGEVMVYRSSGYEALDDSALEAVQKWRFVPGKQGDSAIATWVNIPIEFELMQ